jgi:hypothetical protein
MTAIKTPTAAPTGIPSPQTGVILANLAYSNQLATDLQTALPNWTLEWQGTVTTDGNTAFIASDPSGEYYALAFRGSLPPFDVLKDWNAFANWILEDMDVVTEQPWPYVSAGNTAKISNGANTAFNNVLAMTNEISGGSTDSILTYLQTNAVNNQKTVIIAGHSLGGNIANVYASYFTTSNAGFNNTYLYTYAAPAAGDSGFAQDLDNKIANAWHYENLNDIVPKFPVTISIILGAVFLYSPAPYSGDITTTYKGLTVSLRDGILLLAGALSLYGYTQQALNYQIFPNPLDPTYETNTMKDWFEQAGAQHAVTNYATYLGVTLQPINSDSPFAAT